jgi:hypothetical protein
MKRILATSLAILVSLGSLPLAAQSAAQPTAQPAPKTLASSIEVQVFPAKGQAAKQQSADEAECYSWSVKNTGADPFELSKQAQAQAQNTAAATQEAQQAGKGSGLKGAAVGAASGALIGEIASGNAGAGAAWGAAGGALIGHRRKKKAQAQATAQVEAQGAQAQASLAQQMDSFKKAFSACLEAKQYIVKY